MQSVAKYICIGCGDHTSFKIAGISAQKPTLQRDKNANDTGHPNGRNSIQLHLKHQQNNNSQHILHFFVNTVQNIANHLLEAWS
jgi:hypothetical protein